LQVPDLAIPGAGRMDCRVPGDVEKRKIRAEC
jgi:hypothetical protein